MPSNCSSMPVIQRIVEVERGQRRCCKHVYRQGASRRSQTCSRRRTRAQASMPSGSSITRLTLTELSHPRLLNDASLSSAPARRRRQDRDRGRILNKARSADGGYVEGRLSEDALHHFRREITSEGKGLSSYPHPWLMPDYWEFPTVSMGLGPIMSIYQARFNRYLRDRGLKDTEPPARMGVRRRR